MFVKLSKLKMLVNEAFSDKELANASSKYKRLVQPQLRGAVGQYVGALEKALAQAGKSSALSIKDVYNTISQGMSSDVSGRPEGPEQDPDVSGLFEPGPSLPTASPEDVTSLPDKQQTPPPLPTPSTSALHKQAMSQPPPLPKSAPRSNVGQQAADRYLSGQEPSLGFDPGLTKALKKGQDPKFNDTEYMKNIRKGLGQGSKKLGFDPTSPHLDPNLVNKLNR